MASTWLVYLAWGVAPMLWRDLWCCLLLGLGWNWWRGAPLGLKASVFANALVLGAIANAIAGLLQWIQQLLYPVPDALGYVQGFMHQRNHFASLLMMGLLALAFGHWPRHVSRAGSATAIAISALLGAALSLSSSRTGGLMLLAWWAMLELGAVWLGKEGYARRTLILGRCALGAYLAMPFIPGLLGASTGMGIFSRVSEGGAGCQSRLTLWSNVLDLIVQKPWLGWGWGELDYAHFVTQYPGERFCDILDNAHNLPLHLAVELGLPAAIALCAVCAWLVWRNRPWAQASRARQLAWSVLAVIGFHSLLEYPLWYGPFQLAALLSIGLLCVPCAQSEVHLGLRHRVSVPGMAFAGLVIALCGYVAWDYHRVSQIYLQPVDRSPAYRTNTLQKIQGSWLFSRQVEFAELTLTQVTPDNAAYINATAHRLLHFSPEARVVEKLIDSAQLLGKPDEVEFFRIRYKAAYPDKFEQWQQRR